MDGMQLFNDLSRVNISSSGISELDFKKLVAAYGHSLSMSSLQASPSWFQQVESSTPRYTRQTGIGIKKTVKALTVLGLAANMGWTGWD